MLPGAGSTDRFGKETMLVEAGAVNMRFFRRLVASLWLAAVFAAVLTTALTSASYRRVVIRLAIESNAIVLRQAVEAIDRILAETYATAYVSNTREISYHGQVDIFADVSRFTHLMREITRTSQALQFVTDYVVYYEDEGLLFGASDRYRLVLDRNQTPDSAFWGGMYRSGVRGFQYLYDEVRGEWYLTMMRTFPGGVVVASTPRGAIAEALTALAGRYAGNTYVLDPEGELIRYAGEDQQQFYERYLLAGFRSDETINVDDYYIQAQKTTSFGWTVVSAVDKRAIAEELLRFAWISLICVLGVTILAIPLVLRYGAHMYRPIRSIVRLVSSSGASVEVLDEFDYIYRAVEDAVRSKAEVLGSWSRDHSLLVETQLRHLLHDDPSDLRLLEGRLFGDRYSVALVKPLGGGWATREAKGTLSVIRMLLTERLSSRRFNAIALETDRYGTAVVTAYSGSDESSVREFLIHFLEAIAEVVAKELGLTVGLGVSSTVSSIQDLRDAVQQANTAIEFGVLRGNDSVGFYDEIPDEVEDSYHETALVDRFVDAVISTDRAASETETDRVLAWISKNAPSSSAAHDFMIELTAKLRSTLRRLGLQTYMEHLQYQSIGLHENEAELRSWICGIVDKTIQIVEGKVVTDANHHDRRREEIVSFLECNYQQDISLTDLANHCMVTPSYMSSEFKKIFGTNFLFYLNQYRIDRARTLLRDESLSVREIARAVGFGTDQRLIRAFKRYTGMTPGRFRTAGSADA